MLIATLLRGFIEGLYWWSPYRWLDAACAAREQAASDPATAETLRQRRYLISECYIAGWLVLAAMAMVEAPALPAWIAYPAALRIIGILNKEAGIVLFGTCKITPGRVISNFERILPIALCNYLQSCLLFALLYTKLGHYAVNGAQASLDVPHAMVQAFSMHFFMIGPALPANDDLPGWWLIIAQGVFCFLFSTLVISLFISSLKLEAARPLG